MKNRILPLLLVIIMCLGLFAACGSSELKAYSDDPETSPGAEETAPPAKDYSAAFETYAPDTVMLTVDGIDITWQELFYWYHYDVNGIESNYGDIEDWDAATTFEPTQTYRQLVTEDALNMIKYYHVVESKAKEYGVTLSAADRAALDADWQSNAEQYGSEESFVEYLAEAYLTKELYYRFSEIVSLYTALQNEICGENGEKLSEEDVLARAQDAGYMRAKHILLKTVDDAQEPLGDDVIAEKHKLAEDLLAQLQEIKNPAELEAKVDEFVAEYGEDEGMEYYTQGYTFLPGKMVSEFEEATLALEDYQISGIVETQFGYHIILRLPLKADAAVEQYGEAQFHSLAYMMAQTIFPAMHEGWAAESKAVFSKTYEEMDLAQVFAKSKTAEK